MEDLLAALGFVFQNENLSPSSSPSVALWGIDCLLPSGPSCFSGGDVHLELADNSLFEEYRQLTESLLRRDFQLEVDIPLDRLIPPVRLLYF